MDCDYKFCLGAGYCRHQADAEALAGDLGPFPCGWDGLVFPVAHLDLTDNGLSLNELVTLPLEDVAAAEGITL